MEQFVFWCIAIFIVLSAFFAMIMKNIFHCALLLAAALFGVAGIFVYLGAEFLALVQVLIYVGAITILIIFGIMLTHKMMDSKIIVMNKQVVMSAVITGVLGTLIILTIYSTAHWILPALKNSESGYLTHSITTASVTKNKKVVTDVYTLGPALINPKKGFAFAFELVSILLLSVLIGATVIARKDQEG
jgi:NADH-quinone oxidoreductase subunit J